MQDIGVDLAVWWKARRWVALLELLDQMPRTARWRAAMANDPEFAREWLAREQESGGDDEPPWSPPLTEWDTKAELAAEARDLLQDVVKLLVGIRHGVPTVQVERLKSPPKLGGKPFPRPVTAIEQAREEAAREAGRQVLAWFFPHASDN